MDAEDDEIEQKFRELCLTVNMDKPTMEMAWQSYEIAKTNYTLEVKFFIVEIFSFTKSVKRICLSLKKIL